MTGEGKPTVSDVPDTFYEAIGRISSEWATLEYLVDECIWTVAEVNEQFGACITSQIYTIDGRLRALVSILKLRETPKDLIETVQQFAKNMKGPSERRNRAIHDPLGRHIDGSTRRLQITAQNSLVFEVKKIDMEELQKDKSSIGECVGKFMTIRDRIKALPATSPGKLPPKFPAITRQEDRRK